MENPAIWRFGCLADGRACAGGDAGRHTLVRQASLGCTCYPQQQAYEAPPICSLTTSTPSTVGGRTTVPNGRPECAGSTVMLTAEMDAPVAAKGHAAEIDILLGFLPSCHPSRVRTAAVGWGCWGPPPRSHKQNVTIKRRGTG